MNETWKTGRSTLTNLAFSILIDEEVNTKEAEETQSSIPVVHEQPMQSEIPVPANTTVQNQSQLSQKPNEEVIAARPEMKNNINSEIEPEIKYEHLYRKQAVESSYHCGCKTCSEAEFSSKHNKNQYSCNQRVAFLINNRHMEETEACRNAYSFGAYCPERCSLDTCQNLVGYNTNVTEFQLNRSLNYDHSFNSHSYYGDHERNETLKRSRNVMIIATYPNSADRLAAIWSQIQCLSHDFKIVISAPIGFENEIRNFVEQVSSVDSRIIDTFFFENKRYDYGLWCDALTEGGLIKPNETSKQSSGVTFLGGESAFDHFMLINDSILSLEKSNLLLDSLLKQNASLVSLNYWGNKTSGEKKYWLESALRIFNKEGIQTYVDHICSLPPIKWRKACPQLRGFSMSNKDKNKRCIVLLSEIRVVDHFQLDKVYGIFKGYNSKYKMWARDFEFWKYLRHEMGFPFAKISTNIWPEIQKTHKEEVGRCTAGYGNWNVTEM